MNENPRLIDLTGQRFGRLIVLARDRSLTRLHTHWLCRCDCGTTRVIQGSNLRSGHTSSCGCFADESRAVQVDALHQRHRTHGQTKTTLYGIWHSMVKRCHLPSWEGWHRYGGRGIKVCDEWRDFTVFAQDMGPRPPGMTLDRIDVNGDYCPSNCRWATRSEQQRNRRDTFYATFGGETLPLATWADRVQISTQTLRHRLRKGWSIQKTLTEPLGGKQR